MLHGIEAGTERAWQSRQQMSLPAVILRIALKERPAGLKLRKQHPSGPYTADFYRHAARLIVEVDGAAHEHGDRPGHDAARDCWFASRDLAVMRMPAVEVLHDADAVDRGIVAFATAPSIDQE